MNTEVIDSFTADTIEDGDFLSVPVSGEFDEVHVNYVEDTDEGIHIEGFSELSGDSVEYNLHYDEVVHLLGIVSEDI